MSSLQGIPDTETIWRKLNSRLRQFVRSRIASHADVDDILQDVFLSIHRKLGSLQQTDRLESWVFQIARNAIADYYRRTSDNVLNAEVVEAPVDDSTENWNSEAANCLGVLIEQLPGQLQRAVSMYARDGVSQKEIASRESISLSGAKSRVQRGRKLLREVLERCCRFQLDRHGNVVSWGRPSECSGGQERCPC
jgi:RNA polymerase sigma-70 factor (ECF subfamily)